METLSTVEPSPPEPDRAGALLWHPFTPRGCARGVFAPPWQVWLLAFVVALVCGMTLRGLAQRTWVPVIDAALAALPEEGGVGHGLLMFPATIEDRVLGGNRFLSIGLAATADVEAMARDSAGDIRLRLLNDRWEVCSLAGCMSRYYGRETSFPLNRLESPAWWAAWKPLLLLTLVAVCVAVLLLAWFALAVLYNFPLQFAAFFMDRDLNWSSGARLVVLSLLPGALLINLGLIGYGAGWFDPFDLAIFFGIHLLLVWGWLVFAARALPRAKKTTSSAENPFSSAAVKPRKFQNPFTGS